MVTAMGKMMATLGLDASGFSKGLGGAEKEVDGFGGKFSKSAKTMGLALGGVGVAAAGLGVLSVKAFADFEGKMNEVFTLMPGISQSSMDAMAGDVKGLAKEFGVLPDESIPALYSAISAGIPSGNAIEFLEQATKTAKGGVTDLETAVDGLTTGLSAFGLDASEAERVSDALFTGMKFGKTTVGELSGSIGKVAPVANAMGVSLEETVGAMSAMTLGGFSTAEASTNLAAALKAVAKPGGDMAAVFEAAGFASGQAAIEQLGLAGALDLVAIAAGGDVGALMELTGTMEGANAILSLTGAQADDFTAIMDGMGDKVGATEAAFKQMDKGIGPVFAKLKGHAAVAMLDIGEKLAPAVEKLGNFLIKNLPRAIDAVGQAWKRMQAFMVPIVAAFVAIQEKAQPLIDKLKEWFALFVENEEAMKAAGIILGVVLVLAFGALAIAAGAAAISVALAIAPFLLVAFAIGALVALVVLIIQHWDEIVEKFPLAGVVLEGVKEIWADFVAWVTETFIPLFTQLVEAVSAAMTAIVGFVQSNWDTIDDIFMAAGAFILKAVTDAFELIKNIIEGTLKIITGIINVVLGVLTGDWDRAWEGIKQILDGVWQIMSGIVEFFLESIKNILTNGLDLLKQIWDLAWNVIKTVMSNIWDGIKTLVVNAVDFVKEKIADAWNWVKTKTSELWGGIKDAINDKAEDIKSTLSDAWESVKSTVTTAWDNIKTAIKDALVAMYNRIIEFGGDVVRWFGELPGRIIAAMGALAGMMRQLAIDVALAFIGGLKSMAGAVYDGAVAMGESAYNGVKKGVGKLIPGSPSEFGLEVGYALGQGIAQGTEDAIPLVHSAAQQLSIALGRGADVLAGNLRHVLGAQAFRFYDQSGLGEDEIKYQRSLEHIASAFTLTGDVYAKVVKKVKDAGLSKALISQIPLEELAKLVDITEEMDWIFEDIAAHGETLPHVAAALDLMGESMRKLSATGVETWKEHSQQWTEIVNGSLATAEEWAIQFRKAPMEAAAGFNELNDYMRMELAKSDDLLDAWATSGLTMFEDYTFDLKNTVAPQMGEAVWEVLSTMDDRWSAAAEGFGRDVEADLTVWRDIMVEGLRETKRLSSDELTAMFEHLNWLLANDELPDTAADLARTAMQALQDEFRETGSVANQALINLLNDLLNTAVAGTIAINNAVASAGGEAPIWAAATGGVHHDGAGRAYVINPAGSVQYLRRGGNARGGWTVVGEGGPELLKLPRGAMVKNARDTSEVMNGLDSPAAYKALAHAASVAAGSSRGITVQQNGPVTIYANDPDQGASALDDWRYGIAARLRAKGVA